MGLSHSSSTDFTLSPHNAHQSSSSVKKTLSSVNLVSVNHDTSHPRSSVISALAAAYSHQPRSVQQQFLSRSLAQNNRFIKLSSSDFTRSNTGPNTSTGSSSTASSLRRIRSAESVSEPKFAVDFIQCKNCFATAIGRVLSPNGDLFCSGDCYFSYAFRKAESHCTNNSSTVTQDDCGFAAAADVNDNFDQCTSEEDRYFNLRKLEKNFAIHHPGNERISNPMKIPTFKHNHQFNQNSLEYLYN